MKRNGSMAGIKINQTKRNGSLKNWGFVLKYNTIYLSLFGKRLTPERGAYFFQDGYLAFCETF
jgi:hypothetical protein